jgi:hypothetical protein
MNNVENKVPKIDFERDSISITEKGLRVLMLNLYIRKNRLLAFIALSIGTLALIISILTLLSQG